MGVTGRYFLKMLHTYNGGDGGQSETVYGMDV